MCSIQIADKRRREQMEKDREKMEEEKENRRLEEQRLRMQSEYDEEQKKIRAREEEVLLFFGISYPDFEVIKPFSC